ncbi:MAG: dual specificity protein phosphatase family protein [Anaerolineales bacterium]|nr:dual specificity protein phosphatase family protein [Anaerolineales bacterium]
MIEIYPNLYVGNANDYENDVRYRENWLIVHACKEPYHRQALGYTGRGAPKNHPEYLIAKRGSRLILNLVDAPNPAYMPKEIFDEALSFIHTGISADKQILVHCNQGQSRSPGIGLLYLAMYTDRLPQSSYVEAENAFRNLYPAYNPANGVRGFLIANWDSYFQPTNCD